MRSAPPIALTLSPWTGRKDAKTLTADREDSEAAIRTAHATMAGSATPTRTTATPPEQAGYHDRSGTTDTA